MCLTSADKEWYCFPFKRLSGQDSLWKALLPPFPTNSPTIPCYNNWVVTHPIRCQGCAEASAYSCFWGICHVRPPPQAQGETMGVFVSHSAFHQLGAGCWGVRGEGSVSALDRNKCSLHSFTSVPTRDVFRVAQRKQGCLCGRQRQAGQLCLFSSPDHQRLRVVSQMLFHPFKPLSSLILCSFHQDFLY